MKLSKNHLFVFLTFFFLLFISGCNEEFTATKKPIQTDDEVLKKIMALGIARENIVDKGDYYVAEKDMVFYKNPSVDSPQPLVKPGMNTSGRVEQYFSDFKSAVSFGRQTRITVRLDASMPTSGDDDWSGALKVAIDTWNKVKGVNLFLVFVTDATANITVTSDKGSLDKHAWAQSDFPPGGGIPGKKIQINLDAEGNVSLTKPSKITVLIHELGHTLGFLHSNALEEAPSMAPSHIIPGTPTLDFNSIMQSSGLMVKGLGVPNLPSVFPFSSDDILSFQIMYPQTNLYGIQYSTPYAIQSTTGEWGTINNASDWYGIAAATIGDYVYLLQEDGSIYKGHRKTGVVQQAINSWTSQGQAMAAIGNSLYVLADNGILYRKPNADRISLVGMNEPVRVGTSNWFSWSFDPPTLMIAGSDGFLYIRQLNAIYQVDPATGESTLWFRGDIVKGINTMTYYNGVVYAGHVTHGELIGFTREGMFETKSHAYYDVTALATFNKKIYAVAGDELYSESPNLTSTKLLSDTWTGTRFLIPFK